MERNERDGEAPTIQLLGDPTVDNGGRQAGDSAVTPLLLLAVFVAICGSFANGSAVGYSSPVESEIMKDLGLSTAAFSLFGSMLTIGSLFGALISGRISDLIARRGAIGLSDSLTIVGWITISVSQEAWSLDLGRFFIGAAIGILNYVNPVYISEITPKNIRGKLSALTQLMMSCGIVVMFFAGSVIPWRILVFLGLIPSLLQLVCVFVIPESPRFLAKLGERKAYETVLQRLRGDDIDISHEAAEIEEFNERLKQIPEVGYLGLFQRKYAESIIAVFGLMALAGLGGPTGVTFYASSVLESAGFTSSTGSIGLAIIQIPSSVIGVFLIDKCGRRPLLMVSAGAMCFCCILVGSMFLLEEYDCMKNVSPYVIVLGLWGYSGAYPFGMGGIPYVIMSEIFPMNVKGSAGSLASVVGVVALCIVTYTFNFVAEWSYPGAFFILAGLNAIAVLFTAKFVPETKERTLEEIQDSLSHVLD